MPDDSAPRPPPTTADRLPGGSIAPVYFERLYAGDADPWQFATSPYERAKYAATVAALPRARYGSAFEIGCAGGVLTRHLADRCARLLAVDVSETVLAQARARCADQPHVTFQRMAVPGEWPDGALGLVVLSEVGYYLGDADFAALGDRLDGSVEPSGHLVLVHWTGPTDYPRTGDAVHDAFLSRPVWQSVGSQRAPEYRLDVLERQS